MGRLNQDQFKDEARKRSQARRRKVADAGPPVGGRRNDLAPKLVLETRPIAALIAASRRLRKADERQIARVREAIGQLGFCSPIAITSQGDILDGHIRWEAAKQLGQSEVPCLVIDHLSPQEQRVLRLALNRLPECGVWDFDALRLELNELIDLGAPVELGGFSSADIDIILLDDEPAGLETGPLAPDPGRPPICQLGQLWALGPHLLYVGDAREPQAYDVLFDDRAQAQLIITDPPYNVPVAGHVTSGEHREFLMASGEMSPDEFAGFNSAWMQAAGQRLTDGGLMAVFIDWRSVDVMIAAGRSQQLQLINLAVWAKTNPAMGSLWRSQHELIPIFKKGQAAHRNNVSLGRRGRNRSNLWQYPGASSLGSDARAALTDHPTSKSVALLEDAMLDVTDRGDIVLDVFLGSGSTLIAAERSGRICRAIELDPLYADVSIQRWINETGGEPELLTRRRDPGPEPRGRAESETNHKLD